MDIPAMRANFAKAAATGDEAPLYFYSHLFLSHPETRALFPVSMAHQRDRLFAALGDVVARVDDLEALVPILQQLGRDHRKFGTVAAHYPAVGASLLATLEHFDDEWTPELAKSWSEAYDVVATVMIEAADAAAEQPAWWEADVVGHERRTHRRRRPAGAPAGAATTTRPGSRSRWRPTCGRSCGATTPPPTRRGRTASWRSTSRPGTAARSARRWSAGSASATCCGSGRRWGTSSLHDDSDRDLLLVAGGMGLAPLKALIDHVARKGPARRVDLFVGFRTRGPDLRPRRPASGSSRSTPG